MEDGPDGLQALRQIIRGAPEVLLPGGRIILECAPFQVEAAARLLLERGFREIACHRLATEVGALEARWP